MRTATTSHPGPAAHDVEFVWADQPLTPQRRSTMIRDPEGNMIHFFGPLTH